MPFTRRALLAASALAAAAQTPVRLPKRLRVAMIGFDGHPGEITEPLPLLPDVEIVATADGNPETLARQAKSPRLTAARQYSDYREMLAREKDLDVVAVCNNNGDRAAAVIAAAERGCNVIAEKPLAINREDYLKVRRTVEARRIALGLLVPMRFEPPYLALKKIVEEGLLGDIIQIAGQKSYKAAGSSPWRRNRATYGSTILWIGIHMIDLMRWTSSRELTEVVAWQTRVGMPELRDQENTSVSMYKLDNGGYASLRMDYARPTTAPTHGDDRLRLAGTKGVAEYQIATGVTLVTAQDKPRVIADLPPKGSVFIDYLESTYNGKKPIVTASEIWRINEITLAAHESAASGRLVTT